MPKEFYTEESEKVQPLLNMISDQDRVIARLQREAADAKTDALRLHREKMEYFELNIGLRAALEIAVQLETALSEYLTDTYWVPNREHIERARNDAARMARALASEHLSDQDGDAPWDAELNAR